MDLRDRRVLITGGTRGIGRALVETFASSGCQMTTCGRDPQRADELSRALPGVDVLVTDLADPDAPTQLAQHMTERHGGLDVLINNAAVQLPLSLQGPASASSVQTELTVNLIAPMRLTSALLPTLLQSDHAAIVNVTSVLGAIPKARAPFYSVEKAGIRSFTRLLRDHLRGTSVVVMEAMPGLMDTDMAAHVTGPSKHPPAEFARAVRDGLARDRHEVIWGANRWLLRLDRVAPSLTTRFVA